MKPISTDRTGSSKPRTVVHLSSHCSRTTLFLFALLLVVHTTAAWPATVAGTIVVAVTPSNVTLTSGATQQFGATLQGTANTSVRWSASAGTITSSGLFTAPKVSSTAGVTAVTITVTSAADPTKTAIATVAVMNQLAAGKTIVGNPNAKISMDPMPLQQSNFDGPAELPRVYVDSDLSNTPSPGKSWNVSSGGSLEDALNNASCGDTIYLQAGATFQENVTVPAKNCDDGHWITVRTSAQDSALPPEGTRITPCYAGVKSLPGRPDYKCSNPNNVMAKVLLPKGGTGPLVMAPGANHYRFIGLEVTRNVNTGIVYSLLAMTPGYTADHIVFDRMWVHGTAHDETQKGLRLGGSTYVAVVDSYFTDMHCTSRVGACTDAVAIGGGIGDNPMGPYKIVDNFLESSGENILFGGAEATLNPSDIEIRSNHMFKPLTWMKGQPGYVGGKDGYPFIVKNLFELKNAQRVLFEGNVLENSWGGFTQTGYGFLLTPDNQATDHGCVCPLCQVTDVTMRYSKISHVASGMQIADGVNGGGGAALAGRRYSIHDIVIDDIDGTKYSGFGVFAQISMGKLGSPVLQDVSIQHVTGFPSNVFMNTGDKTPNKIVNFTFVNSIVLAGSVRPFSSTGGTSNCAQHIYYPQTLLNECFDPYSFTGNAVIATPKNVPPNVWPAGNYFPSSPQGMFVNYNGGNGGDYHLVGNSPYMDAGTDGGPLGANIDLIDQYTQNSQ